MNDAARLLRYAAPGALFLLLYGVWFLIDSHLAERDLPDIGGGTAVLIAGAAIPIGFVAQVISAEITWLWWPRARRWRPFRTINNRGIVDDQIRAGRTPVTGEGASDVELVGVVDAWIQGSYIDEKHPHALNRLRSVADLYQGLANGTVASALAWLLAVGTVFATSCWLGEPVSRPRIELLGVCLAVCGLLCWWMCASHRRVVSMAEAMAREILGNRASDD